LTYSTKLNDSEKAHHEYDRVWVFGQDQRVDHF